MGTEYRLPRMTPPAEALRAVHNSYEWSRTWRYVIVKPAVKNIGLAAVTFANKRGFQVRPGVRRLMAITGYSKPAVIESIATMRYLGFLWRIKCGKGADSKEADEYQLCLPRTLEHLAMVDAKTAEEPDYLKLPPVAQQTAILLGVAKRLAKEGGQLTQPGVVNSVNHPWFAQLTTPTHVTKSSTHHSDQHDRADAGASAPKYDFDDEDDCYDYIVDHVGDLDPVEGSTVDGMLTTTTANGCRLASGDARDVCQPQFHQDVLGVLHGCVEES